MEYLTYDILNASISIFSLSDYLHSTETTLSQNYQPFYNMELWNGNAIIIMMRNFKELEFIYVERSSYDKKWDAQLEVYK